MIVATTAESVISTDISPYAVKNARLNTRANHLDDRIEVLRCDFASALKKNAAFDCVFFNPPYLPTDKAENDWFARSWSGGVTGLEFTERAIVETESLLRSEGDIRFLVSRQEGLERIRKLLSTRGFDSEVIESRSFFYDRLFAVKAERTA